MRFVNKWAELNKMDMQKLCFEVRFSFLTFFKLEADMNDNTFEFTVFNFSLRIG